MSESIPFATPLEIPEEYIIYANGEPVSRFCDMLVWDADEALIILVSQDWVLIDTVDDMFAFHIKPGFEPKSWEAAAVVGP